MSTPAKDRKKNASIQPTIAEACERAGVRFQRISADTLIMFGLDGEEDALFAMLKRCYGLSPSRAELQRFLRGIVR